LEENFAVELEAKQKRGILIGALIGAILGAGAAHLLITAPGDLAEAEELKPLTATELISLTSLAASLIRRLDDFRRRT
jgi:gas vesicle protein